MLLSKRYRLKHRTNKGLKKIDVEQRMKFDKFNTPSRVNVLWLLTKKLSLSDYNNEKLSLQINLLEHLRIKKILKISLMKLWPHKRKLKTKPIPGERNWNKQVISSVTLSLKGKS